MAKKRERKARHTRKRGGTGFLSGATLGALLGVALGALLTPTTGEENRKKLKAGIAVAVKKGDLIAKELQKNAEIAAEVVGEKSEAVSVSAADALDKVENAALGVSDSINQLVDVTKELPETVHRNFFKNPAKKSGSKSKK